MRGQQTLFFLAVILAARIVFGGCLRDTKEAEELPIVVTDSGVRVTFASLEESGNRLILTFRVENERPTGDTMQSVIDHGRVAVESELRYVNTTFQFQDDASDDDETAASDKSAVEVEVTVEKPADLSQPVTFEFTQLLVPSSTGNTPKAIAEQWEFRFVPTAS